MPHYLKAIVVTPRKNEAPEEVTEVMSRTVEPHDHQTCEKFPPDEEKVDNK